MKREPKFHLSSLGNLVAEMQSWAEGAEKRDFLRQGAKSAKMIGILKFEIHIELRMERHVIGAAPIRAAPSGARIL